MQEIRIRGTDTKFNVQEMVWPFLENGIFYLRMIEIDEEEKPTHFLTIVPQDILWRRSDYTEEIMNEINVASDKAHKDQAEYMATQEDIDNTVVDDDRYYG